MTDRTETGHGFLGHVLFFCCAGLIISVITHALGMAEIDQVGASIAGAMIASAVKTSRSIINGG